MQAHCFYTFKPHRSPNPDMDNTPGNTLSTPFLAIFSILFALKCHGMSFFCYLCNWIESSLSKTYRSIASQSPPQVKSKSSLLGLHPYGRRHPHI